MIYDTFWLDYILHVVYTYTTCTVSKRQTMSWKGMKPATFVFAMAADAKSPDFLWPACSPVAHLRLLSAMMLRPFLAPSPSVPQMWSSKHFTTGDLEQ